MMISRKTGSKIAVLSPSDLSLLSKRQGVSSKQSSDVEKLFIPTYVPCVSRAVTLKVLECLFSETLVRGCTGAAQ